MQSVGCHHSHRTPEHTRAVPFHRLGKLSEREDVDVGDPVGLLHELHHHHQQHRAKGQFGELQSPEEGRGGVAEFAATKVLRVNEAMAHNVWGWFGVLGQLQRNAMVGRHD